ncbi:protease HtpX [Dokdonella soli]|uniref:Protease HtpX n=1 Tax=Dokdonella soli TaxID=529810 RepID=A0ABN1IBQ3_9GAMM
MMRVLLFVGTNIAVLVLLNIVLFIVQSVFHVRLGNYSGLLLMAAVMGMGGSFISLAMSKWIAKRTTGAQVITQPRNESERWLLDTVKSEAQKAGIGMPEVAVYDAPDMNAFATGMSRNNALVAVSTGLLQSMDRNQVQAVLGHEITHVANGDMVTMGLIQGVLNTFVIFLARIIGTVVDNALSGNRNSESSSGGFFYFIIVMVLQVALGFLASMVVMWFSRWREFRADAGGARLGGRDNMISALQRLAGNQGETALPKAIQAFGISGEGGISRLFMSHPPIEERIAALRAAA